MASGGFIISDARGIPIGLDEGLKWLSLGFFGSWLSTDTPCNLSMMANVMNRLLERGIGGGPVPAKRDAMDRAVDYIIEIEEEPLGLAIADEGCVVFHAFHPAVQQLHGRAYPDATEARHAALRVFRSAA